MNGSSPRIARVAVAALAALAVVGCTQGRPASRGNSAPTVAGEGAGRFDPAADPSAAKAQFTRSDGPLTAILEDASWIRLEADPSSAAQRYPDYFAGYTTILAYLKTKNFVQPTKETYLLEDSTGARVTTKPEKYRGDTLREFGPKHYAEFTLVFPHVMSKDVRWLKLTRMGAEGGSVQWDVGR